MANRTPRSGDHTAKQKAKLEKENAEEQAKAAARMSTISVETQQNLDEPQELVPVDPNADKSQPTVQDVETGEVEVVSDDNPAHDEIETVEVGQDTKKVKFRVNESLEGVTIGHGNHYDFVAGQVYTAPKFVYDHLEEKGLVWH